MNQINWIRLYLWINIFIIQQREMNKYTNVYLPNSNSKLSFTNNLDSEDEDMKDESKDQNDDLSPSSLIKEIANGKTENDVYKQLLEEYEVSRISADDLIRNILEEQHSNNKQEQIAYSKEKLSSDDCILIFDVKSKRPTRNEAWFICWKALSKGRNILKQFSRALIIQKKLNIHSSRRTPTFLSHHYEFLYNLLQTPQNSALTLNRIKRLIRSRFDDLRDFSLETLRLALKYKIRASYKIVSLINKRFMIAQNVISFARMNKLIETLLSNSIEIIFFDELSINSRPSKTYGWRIKGRKTCIMNKESTERF